MAVQPNHRQNPLYSTTGGALGIVIALVLVLALVGGGGFWAYHQHSKKEPLRMRLASTKVQPDLIRFTHDQVSTALYHNLIQLDDILVMMKAELNRLKRIGNRFPNQEVIIASQAEALELAHDRLALVLTDTTANLEKMYVIWLVDRSKGTGQIHALRGDINRHLADALRSEAVMISRIRTNANAPS